MLGMTVGECKIITDGLQRLATQSPIGYTPGTIVVGSSTRAANGEEIAYGYTMAYPSEVGDDSRQVFEEIASGKRNLSLKMAAERPRGPSYWEMHNTV